MFTTQLYNSNKIIDPLHEDFIQYIETKCPHCSRKVKFAIPSEFTDCESVYNEMKDCFYKKFECMTARINSLEKENKELKKEFIK